MKNNQITGRTFNSRGEYEQTKAAIQQSRPKPAPDKLPEAIIAKRQALYAGKLCNPGDVILIWPATPPKGSGFISEADARALLDALDVDKASPEAVQAFLEANQEGGAE